MVVLDIEFGVLVVLVVGGGCWEFYFVGFRVVGCFWFFFYIFGGFYI